MKTSEPLGEGVGFDAVIANVVNDGGGGGQYYVDVLLFCQNPNF